MVIPQPIFANWGSEEVYVIIITVFVVIIVIIIITFIGVVFQGPILLSYNQKHGVVCEN